MHPGTLNFWRVLASARRFSMRIFYRGDCHIIIFLRGDVSMSVERILAGKGRHVETISPSHTLQEAAKVLAAKRIGAVVVASSDHAVLGILSERDIVRAIASDPARLNNPVSDFMTEKVVTCGLKISIPEIMDEMTSGRFRHLPVVVEGRLSGLISIGDVVKYRVAEIEAESNAMRHYIASA
jgi:CBS domain-containing protein